MAWGILYTAVYKFGLATGENGNMSCQKKHGLHLHRVAGSSHCEQICPNVRSCNSNFGAALGKHTSLYVYMLARGSLQGSTSDWITFL
jgi:hypothetical protein